VAKLAKYRLLVGTHVVSTDPVTFAVPGDLVESDRDLSKVFEAGRFEFFDEDAEARKAAEAQAEIEKVERARAETAKALADAAQAKVDLDAAKAELAALHAELAASKAAQAAQVAQAPSGDTKKTKTTA